MRSVVILVIKNRTTAHGYYSYDYRPNWTLLSPITITNFSLSQSTRFFPVLQAILPKEKTSRLIGYMQFDL